MTQFCRTRDYQPQPPRVPRWEDPDVRKYEGSQWTRYLAEGMGIHHTHIWVHKAHIEVFGEEVAVAGALWAELQARYGEQLKALCDRGGLHVWSLRPRFMRTVKYELVPVTVPVPPVAPGVI